MNEEDPVEETPALDEDPPTLEGPGSQPKMASKSLAATVTFT